MVFSCSNWENSSHTTITRSRTSVGLEVVFLVGLQSPLLKVHARLLDLLKTRTTMIKRLGCGCNVEVVMMRICLDNLMSKMSFVSYVSRSCDWSCSAKVIWLIGLITIILQLPSFLNVNFVEREAICWRRILNGNLVKYLSTNELDWR